VVSLKRIREKVVYMPKQVPDDLELLKLMLDDTNQAADIYKPTNYWSVYEKRFLPELQKLGLHNFRRRKNSVLNSFGATDLFSPYGIDLLRNGLLLNQVAKKFPFWKALLLKINSLLNKALPFRLPYDMNLEELRMTAYHVSCLLGEICKSRPLAKLNISLAGNPEDVFVVNGKPYTVSILKYYLQYAYCCKFINFDKISVLVELGSGMGKQVEIIKKLHPQITFLLFDIPPQLYVCEQYLKYVFPNEVVSYRETRPMDSSAFISYLKKGKIYILGNWKFPILANLDIDLFWNATSFQEMEPEVVANYLAYINKSAKAVFIKAIMEGKELTQEKGKHGVIRQTTIEDYKKGLSNFKLIDLSNQLFPFYDSRVEPNSFWKLNIN
jgi:putative sugar O-methyltransferase